MKYLKLFESMTELEVAKICEKYKIRNWTLQPDGLVDVDGGVGLNYKNLTRLPLRFGEITDHFYCNDNKLTTLEGAPTHVGGHFYCYTNKLTTLEGAPTHVGGHFSCSHNNLTTLEGAPTEVGGSFICRYNNLSTLKGAPEYIDGKVDFLPNGNLPTEFIDFLELNSNREDLQKYILKWQKDYAVWRRDGSFNQANFIQMMEAAQDELQNLKFTK